MAYLKLGETNIRYGSGHHWDKLILSQIIDSSCSYKSPRLIRSVRELEIYFGTSYKDYEYHKELINSGATLFLYKPIKDGDPSIKSGFSGWIDLSGYIKFNLLNYENGYVYPKSDFLIPDEYHDGIYGGINFLLKTYTSNEDQRVLFLDKYRKSKIYTSLDELPERGLIFKKTDSHTGKDIFEETKYIFTILEEGEIKDYYYDDLLEDFICIDELPQTISPFEYSVSKLNRDSLRITDKNWVSRLNSYEGEIELEESSKVGTRVSFPEITSCNPRYSSHSFIPEYPEKIPDKIFEIDQKIQLLTSIRDKEKYIGGDIYSLAYTFDFSEVTEINKGNYIVMNDPIIQGGKLFYFGGAADVPPIGDNEIGGIQINSISIDPSDSVDNLINRLMNSICGLDLNQEVIQEDNYWYLVYKETSRIFHIFNINGITTNSQFFDIEGLKITPDYPLTQDIISLLSNDRNRIEFYSKTIGPGDEDINIKIEKLKPENLERYRITISRYSYAEIFEGNLYINSENGEIGETLEQIINSNSILVECRISKKTQKKEYLRLNKSTGELERLDYISGISYNRLDPDDGLREGEWKLKRSQKEVYTSSDFENSLKELEKNKDIKEDFLLIPDTSLIGLYKLYDYSVNKNCQSLIVNHGLDYLDNIIVDYKGKSKDRDNRLVFFLEDLKYKGHDRPGYYLFLKGLLEGKFLYPIMSVIYDQKYITRNSSGEEIVHKIEDAYNDYPVILERHKTNYLVSNEHNFYYRKLFSHPGDYIYDLTILSRFCQSHVSKVAEREFPKFLGNTYAGDLLNGLERVLYQIKNDYKIIKDLYVESVIEDEVGESMDIYLHLDIRELADKDISLGITLNFNLT